MNGDYQEYKPFSMHVKNVLIDEATATNIKLPSSSKTSLLRNYPNPFNGLTTIQLINPSSSIQMSVYDGLGRLVDKAVLHSSGSQDWVNYESSDLKAGIYFYNLKDEQGDQYKGRFIIQN